MKPQPFSCEMHLLRLPISHTYNESTMSAPPGMLRFDPISQAPYFLNIFSLLHCILLGGVCWHSVGAATAVLKLLPCIQ